MIYGHERYPFSTSNLTCIVSKVRHLWWLQFCMLVVVIRRISHVAVALAEQGLLRKTRFYSKCIQFKIIRFLSGHRISPFWCVSVSINVKKKMTNTSVPGSVRLKCIFFWNGLKCVWELRRHCSYIFMITTVISLFFVIFCAFYLWCRIEVQRYCSYKINNP